MTMFTIIENMLLVIFHELNLANGELKSEEVDYKGGDYDFERFDRRIIKRVK